MTFFKAARISFCLFVIGFSIFSSSAFAQKSSPMESEEYREDHVGDAMKWFENFRNPNHESNYESAIRAGYSQLTSMNNAPAMKSLSSAAWIEVGTSQSTDGQNGLVSGRGGCIAFDKAGTIYYGVTKGGLWKTTNGGTNWTSLSDNWEMLDVGGVAVDPTDANVIYAGTGTPSGGVGGGGDEAGIGIYKSIDAGLNWTILSGSPLQATTQVEVNPASPNIVYYACTAGVYRSDDAGATWTFVLNLGGYTSIVLDPHNPAIMYAAGGGSVEQSIDSGATWTSLPDGYPTGQLMILGMSNVSSDSIYLSTGTTFSSTDGTSILALSTDQGKTWTTQSSNVDYLGTQAFYANSVAVNPTNTSTVVCGGLDIYNSTTGGTNLAKRTNWTDIASSQQFSHADIHVLKYNPYTNVLYALTDGGVYHSANDGRSWSQNMNATLGTLSFVGGDMANDGSFFCAGAQDNGLNALTEGTDGTYRSINGGDGGMMFVGNDNSTIYGTYVYGTLYESSSRGTDWGGEPANILTSPILDEFQQAESQGLAPFYMEYSICDGDPTVVAACGPKNLFLDQSNNHTFPQVTNTTGTSGPDHIVGSVVRAHVSSWFNNGDNNIYLGTSSGTFYASTDAAQSWTKSTSPTSFGGQPTDITNDPNNDTNLCMTVAATTSKHFYYSTNFGKTWAAPATNLPALNYTRVAMDQNGVIYIGHNFGVLRSGDTGKTWYSVADGMPMALVTALHVRGNYLVATTYGRGMYYVDLTQLPPIGSSSVASSNATRSGISILSIYPSIISTSAARTTVDYSLAGDAQATLAVYDVLGRQERMLLNEWGSPGTHELSVDLSGLAAGQYYFVLTSNGQTVTKPMVIQ